MKVRYRRYFAMGVGFSEGLNSTLLKPCGWLSAMTERGQTLPSNCRSANDRSRAMSGSPPARCHASGVRRKKSITLGSSQSLGSFSLPGRSVRYSHGLPAAGAGLAIIAYSVALRSSAGSVDVIRSTALGLALFCLLELGEFARSFKGAAIRKLGSSG